METLGYTNSYCPVCESLQAYRIIRVEYDDGRSQTLKICLACLKRRGVESDSFEDARRC